MTNTEPDVSKVVLASTSRWRREVLVNAGLDVECVAPGVDESQERSSDPVVFAMSLAARKAEAVAVRYPDRWVIGCDQVLWDGHEIFGKPPSREAQMQRLSAMRGASHRLITGWALRGPGAPHDAVTTTVMHMRADVSDAELEAYVATGEGDGCAGGYAVEGRGGFMFSRVDGDWYNVIGIPLFEVLTALRARGWRFGSGR